jgi:hypothetical protein
MRRGCGLPPWQHAGSASAATVLQILPRRETHASRGQIGLHCRFLTTRTDLDQVSKQVQSTVSFNPSRRA